MHQSGRGAPSFQRHLQRRPGQPGFQRGIQSPADHPPRKRVQHHRQENKLFQKPEVRDVGPPELVDTAHRQRRRQVRIHFQPVGGVGRRHKLTLPQTEQVVFPQPEEHKSAVKKKLQNAYVMTEYADAKRALERLHRELMELNPSAARSLEEGMEETLTVHRLRVPAQLRRTLASTNVIESAFSIVETVCRNVKRWRAGDHIERWVGSGLLVAERQFHKVQGYREIPSLLTALANAVSKKAVAEEVKVA